MKNKNNKMRGPRAPIIAKSGKDTYTDENIYKRRIIIAVILFLNLLEFLFLNVPQVCIGFRDLGFSRREIIVIIIILSIANSLKYLLSAHLILATLPSVLTMILSDAYISNLLQSIFKIIK